MNLRIYRATKPDALELAPILRSEDVEEIKAASGLTPLAALSLAVEQENCFTVEDDDGPIGMFGYQQQSQHIASVWMLCSDRALNYPKEICRIAKTLFSEWHKTYFYLMNRVYAKNTKHIEWLTWLGCTFGPERDGFMWFVHEEK